MFLIITFFSTFFFLIGNFLLTALITAFRHLHKQESKKQLKILNNFFFYRPLHLIFFPHHVFEGLFFATLSAQNITRFCYAASAILFLSHTPLFYEGTLYDYSWFWILVSSFAFILNGFLFGDFLPRIFGTKKAETAIRVAAPLSSIFMLMAFPITYIFLKISRSISHSFYFDYFEEAEVQAKQEIIEIIKKAEFTPGISRHDKEIITSVLNFRDHIAREVMVPRIELFSLPGEMSIKEAAQFLQEEGYSRTPVYRTSVDDVIGILMYKDILKKYMDYVEKGNDPLILEAPIESIIKPALYTPETKKISNLLQEFRKKQVHLAIVVDEYGGTEGIVTIEDILEEIVGDIADEYDNAEELFKQQPDLSWIVDARLNISDVEEQIGIKIPQEGDYDTIGGYLYHRAGAIPSKGFVIHHESFEIEVLSSKERSIEKVRIKTFPEEKK